MYRSVSDAAVLFVPPSDCDSPIVTITSIVTVPEAAKHGDDAIAIPFLVRLILEVMNVWMALQDPVLLFYVCSFVFAWLGIFISPFFYSFHLLELVNRSPTLQVRCDF
jgi:hypothetical protein